ncbi:TnsA-like heteromeric transposase endonuclease subunit [Oerskovia sp. NPDC056781]|uniref:TnsA-like heteromeric transposase endonuclease subunit n=1 Tax=Oerskovia TaxID=162491 RepID=UPI0018D4AAF0|nr:TnsA-like heteromeric transposase endonuclease subunit [Oerskovia enterophila]
MLLAYTTCAGSALPADECRAAIGEASQMVATWNIRGGDGANRLWGWQLGAPPTSELRSVRRPAADAMSRHAPVRMWCLTTGSFLVLESGLEYELARSLDRESSIVWLVAQPVLLAFGNGERHVPDLLAEHADGRVVVWDARPADQQDEQFRRKAELTREACSQVGWEYAIYAGSSPAGQLNLQWLTAFRSRPTWPHHNERDHLLARARDGVTVGDIIRSDSGDGHLTATMWHLLWTRELVVDLDVPITFATLVTLVGVRVDE